MTKRSQLPILYTIILLCINNILLTSSYVLYQPLLTRRSLAITRTSKGIIISSFLDNKPEQQHQYNTSLKSIKFPRETKIDKKQIVTTNNNNPNRNKINSKSTKVNKDNGNNSNNDDNIKLWSLLQKASKDEDKVVINIEAIVLLSLTATATYFFSQNPMIFQFVTNVFSTNPTESLSRVVDSIESMGSVGILYFGIIYTIAELLAVPATPLTLSAGYLFGVQQGTAIVLFSAILSATISFAIARTILRSKVEGLLENYPEFQKIDKAIGKEGFKLMLLIRLSPIFPFSLSNYLYGVTSVKFWPYFWGTSLGFAPGTIAYVYTGTVGKALTIDAGTATSQPTYLIGGLVVLAGLVKLLADVATGIIQGLDDDDDGE